MANYKLNKLPALLLALLLSASTCTSLGIRLPSLPMVPLVPSVNLPALISNAGSETTLLLKNMTSSATEGLSTSFSSAMNSTTSALTSAADAAGIVGSSLKNASTAAAESAVNFSFLDTISKTALPGLDSVSQYISTSDKPDAEKTGGFIVSTNVNDIKFLLFNNVKDSSQYREIKYKNTDSLKASGFDPSKPTKFLIHGFQNNLNSTFPQNAKNAYLKSGQDLNVIIVDWGLLALPDVPVVAPIFYPLVVVNVWNTGVRVGEFVSFLKEADASSTNLTSVHIVGFSLGSHVSGKAATDIKARFNQTVGRVTALDPAGPEFYTGLFARKLTKEDATFVDAYHTNAGQLGIWQDVAQVDFYLNGGTGPQPGCLGFDSIKAVFGSFTAIVSGTCSHGWATKLFSETIGSLEALRAGPKTVCACASLVGFKLRSCTCDAKVTLGEHIDFSTSGTYYLDYRFEDQL